MSSERWEEFWKTKLHKHELTVIPSETEDGDIHCCDECFGYTKHMGFCSKTNYTVCKRCYYKSSGKELTEAEEKEEQQHANKDLGDVEKKYQNLKDKQSMLQGTGVPGPVGLEWMKTMPASMLKDLPNGGTEAERKEMMQRLQLRDTILSVFTVGDWDGLAKTLNQANGKAKKGLCAKQWCDKQGKNRCARCGVVAYCGRECQKADWKSGHKKMCQPLQIGDTVEIVAGNAVKLELVGKCGQLEQYFTEEEKWGLKTTDGYPVKIYWKNLVRA